MGEKTASQTPARFSAPFPAGRPACRLEILVNISDIAETHSLHSSVCDGIGLLRTEFLLSSAADLANEEKQYHLYVEMLDWAAGQPVSSAFSILAETSRWAGSPSRSAILFSECAGSACFWRCRRCSGSRPGRSYGLRHWGRGRSCCRWSPSPGVSNTRRFSRRRRWPGGGIEHGIPDIGMMVETPAAAIMLEAFDADFFAIGSSDLLQYVAAAARSDQSLSKL